MAHYFTEKLNKEYKTNIYVDQVAITIFGGVKLRNILIKDEHKDTLIYIKRVNTSIGDARKLINGKLIFGAMRAEELFLNVKTYKGDRDTNLDRFVAAFDDGKPSSGKFLMTSKKVTLINSRFVLIDENRAVPKDVDFTKINAVITDFKIKGANVTTHIKEMSLQDHRGLFVENLQSKFTYTKKNIRLEDLALKTKESRFEGTVILRYNRKDFSDFNNKVLFDIKTESAQIASNDIRYFYNEMGKDKYFSLQGKIDGTLNDFTAKRLHLIESDKSEIIGNVNFKNLFAKQGKGDFYMKGNFKKVASSYENLIALLPNVLGKKLPTSLKKLGRFTLYGKAEITTKTIDADFDLQTKLGNISSQLVMTNINTIDNASYLGTIVLDDFDLGSFLNRKDLGKTSLDLQVDGNGFIEKYLNTSFSGTVSSIFYNGYNYQNVIVDGNFKKPIFRGKVNINDPNLFLDFDGKIDLSKEENSYDFHAKIDYANLNKMNFVNDPVSVIKADIVMKATGNTVDNLKGEVLVTNASYRNSKNQYFFDRLSITSKFAPDNTRMISVESNDGIEANVEGKFKFYQISKIVENSLGSLYANYHPNKVSKGQYLKFNFTEFNKLVEIINPKITLSDDTVLKGTINSDDNDFKVNFSSKSIEAFNVSLDKVQVQIDNKNPLYNAYVQMDSIKSKYYKARDFSLINITSKDTLFFRTEFKGGNTGKDFYNLNLYHTINKENKNVIGFTKSEMMFKDFLWFINEKEDNANKVVFDKGLTNFSFDNIMVSHENQFIQLDGVLNGNRNKDLELVFNEVNLNKITPDLDKFKFDGKVDGIIHIKQNESIYKPTSSLTIKELLVNDRKLGNMFVDIEGDENFSKFNINSVIENENLDSFKAEGNLQIVNGETVLDLNLNFQKFNLGILSNLGGDVINNIRGFASGNARLDGNINDIDYNGRLFIDDAGLRIPYLNVDYQINPNSIVDITRNKFIIQRTQINDNQFNTTGNLEGAIKHKQFGDWELDLRIDSNRLLALNTSDHEDAAYFGKAYMDGIATIKGPTTGLVISVNAKSEKGTDIKIPINDAEAVQNKEYIHFITPKEKYGLKETLESRNLNNYNGLELNFEFDITEDADIEVILNRDSGHGMKGRGKGGLLFRINTLGKFEMYGDYQVYEGSYNFKYGGLLDKKLEVKKFGSIVWEGSPYNAILDLEAIYKTTANPAVLIENNLINKKIPVEVSISIKGALNNPQPDFNINFPNLNSIVKAEIETKLNDPSTRQTQALYLLSTGGFLSQDGLNQSQYTNFALERASAIFGDLLNDKDGKMQFDVNYIQADRTSLDPTNSRVVATISTTINERITVNGKVGVPVGGVTETAIVGNVEVQYRVNEDGTLNLRVFNRENDINYIGQGIGYTQGLGVSYEVDFDTFKELVNKIFKKRKLDRANTLNNHLDDSDLSPKNDDSKENEKDKKEQDFTEPNQEAIPSEYL